MNCEAKNSFEQRSVPCIQDIRGEEVHYQGPKWVCTECEAAFMSPEQATLGVKAAVETYQSKHGFLIARKIRDDRTACGLSVAELASDANVGVATIKRLEAGTTVQQASTDTLIRKALENHGIPGFSIETEVVLLIDSDWIADTLKQRWNPETPWNKENPWSDDPPEDQPEPPTAADSKELALAA